MTAPPEHQTARHGREPDQEQPACEASDSDRHRRLRKQRRRSTSSPAMRTRPAIMTDSIMTSRNRQPSACRSARSEEHTSELQSLMRISYAVFCLKKKKTKRKWTLVQAIHKAYKERTSRLG